MAKDLLRLAIVGVLMFGGGIAASEMLPRTTPGLPLTGTQCGSEHCAPEKYAPPMVANVKGYFQPSCPIIAPIGPIVQNPNLRIETAKFATVNAPAIVSAATTSSGMSDVDADLAKANQNAVVTTTGPGGQKYLVFILFKCSLQGLAEQYVRMPYNSATPITIETIRLQLPK